MDQSFSGAIRWAGDASKCLDVQGGSPLVGAHVGLWACRADHPNQQFAWSEEDGRIRWLTYPSLCLTAAAPGSPIQLDLCNSPTAAFDAAAHGTKAICTSEGVCMTVQDTEAHPVRDGSPVMLGEMAAKDLLHPSAAWLFHTGVSCSGETFCSPLANCYEDCRTSGEYNKACWQSSCCPSGTDAEYNRSDFNYYACTFTGNTCMERCNGWFQSRRCHGSEAFCPLLANCYEACRLSHKVGSCQHFEDCPGNTASFNDSSASFYLLALSPNRCLSSCNLEHAPYQYCSGRSFCPQLASCYQDCFERGRAPPRCPGDCCPELQTEGLRGASPPGYDDSGGGYYRCEIGNSCLETCNGRFAAEEPGTLESRHVPRVEAAAPVSVPPPAESPLRSPLASGILLLSLLLVVLALGIALLNQRKQMPFWTGPVGRFLQRQRLDCLPTSEASAGAGGQEEEAEVILYRSQEESSPAAASSGA
ncbi:unnamed protein product [Symbiodinium sp. CCMP2592]|nr:unnamed protein product [Symbiodinium sp. CCMP2592]